MLCTFTLLVIFLESSVNLNICECFLVNKGTILAYIELLLCYANWITISFNKNLLDLFSIVVIKFISQNNRLDVSYK